MITERTFTVTVSFVQHGEACLPSAYDMGTVIAKALQEQYPNRSINVQSTYTDTEYGKEGK